MCASVYRKSTGKSQSMRLDLFRTARDQETGRRRYLHPKLTADDFKRVQDSVIE